MKRKLFGLSMVAAAALTFAGCAGGGSAANTTADSDVDYIKNKGKLIVGITDFNPMDYKDSNNEWIGFDADLAKKVAADLGVEVEFVEIDWDNKLLELNNKSIDVVWNGMTYTNEVKDSMECTESYCKNAQTFVLKSTDAVNYTDVDSVKNLTFAVEAGSAGESVAKENGFNYTAKSAQSDALLEVKSGTSQAAIIDLLMAGAMVGPNTDYSDLTHILELSEEDYVVGCRKGSDLAAYINDEFAKFKSDGSFMEIATKYGVQDAVVK